MKYKALTLGCKVNQFETQALEALLRDRGMTPAGQDEKADLVIINTCAVTAESGRKSRQAIRRIMSDNEGAIAAVCGCYSQLDPDAVRELGVQVIHGSGSKESFADDIMDALNEKHKNEFVDNPFERRKFEELLAGAADGRTRAMLKIQDGCVNFCTYCIIPYTRGRLRSLPKDRCAAQAKTLYEEGFKEVVVTGIEIASYGRDLDTNDKLADAIEAIASESGDMRIRLGSLEPTCIDEDFCRRIAATQKLCDHFHLSLQSGSDGVLKRMNRKYDTARFMESVDLLRKYFPGCGITADLITGFPGETLEEHKETLEFLRKVKFSQVHVFPYSIRPGTKAAKMPGQLTSAEKSRRAQEAQKISDEMHHEFLESCVGKTFPVLFETEHNGMSVGHAPNYAQVSVNQGHLHGVVKHAQIIGISNEMLVGKVL